MEGGSLLVSAMAQRYLTEQYKFYLKFTFKAQRTKISRLEVGRYTISSPNSVESVVCLPDARD
jgi:hypothetical protein